MVAYIISFLVGTLCIVLGGFNAKGNISSLHSYHRARVSEEDRLPFGRMVGGGTILIGAGICLLSILSAVALLTERTVFTWIGTGILILSLVVGLGLSFCAMIKYNKGIF